MDSYSNQAPSLTSSEGDTGSESNPMTPAYTSPQMLAQQYTLPMDVLTLHPTAATADTRPSSQLPDINDPTTVLRPVETVVCIGAGYVGGPTAAMIALHNPHVRVTVVDRDQKRIEAWKGRHLPIHEPGLSEVVRAARDGQRIALRDHYVQETGGLRQPNLFFSTACAESIAEADMVLISVNTPTKQRGHGAGRATDMTAFEGATRDVATHAKNGCILVEKSTVPCKTGQLIKNIMEESRPGESFPVLSNPEFLSEGTAIRDLMRPDRVIIGCESTYPGHRAAAALATLYAAWVPRERISSINIWSSELCKLAANAMLAQRISSINSISAICEKTGADVTEIAKSVGMDKRIGPQFLKAGLGFGGSCFRKDIASLTYLAESLGLPEVALYWQQVLDMNDFQRGRFARQVIATLNNSLRGKKIAILGYAFKKDTGDARESPALDVIRILLEEGPRNIAIYDPLCSEADIKYELKVLAKDGPVMKAEGGPVEVLKDPYEACKDSGAVLVLTDWDLFKIPTPVAVSAQPIKPQAENVKPVATTPEGFLRLGHADIVKPASGPQPKPSAESSLYPDPACLLPEPKCPSNCAECASCHPQNTKPSGATAITTPMDWSKIAKLVKQPVVFDGRNVLDLRAMSALGFRLETLGRASMA